MICRACGFRNDGLQTTVCQACGASIREPAAAASRANVTRPSSYAELIAAAESRLDALTQNIVAVEAERAAIAEVLSQVRRGGADLDIAAVRVPQAAASRLDVGTFRVLFEDQGSRIESELVRPAGGTVARVLEQPAELPAVQVRSDAERTIWSALAGGAQIVSLAAQAGAGTTTLVQFVAARARSQGFADGAVYLTDARGPAVDLGQRLASLVFAQPVPAYYSPAELRQMFAPMRALVVLDRAELTNVDQAELSSLFPTLRWIIVDVVTASPPTVDLGPLAGDALVTMVEAGYGRPIEPTERAAVIALSSAGDSLPGPARLIGVAADTLQRTFVALHAEFCTATALTRALIASLAPDQQRVLAFVALAPTLLTDALIAQIDGSDERRTLERLSARGLIRCSGAGAGYEVPHYVAELVPLLEDTDRVAAKIAGLLRTALCSSTSSRLLDCQFAAAENVVATAFERSQWPQVLALGPKLAQLLALQGLFGAWGRVLNLVAAAAKRVDDTAVLALARHELGIRSLLLGEHHKAAALLRSAARERRRAGDEAGAGASEAVLALVQAVPVGLDGPPTAVAPKAPAYVPEPALQKRREAPPRRTRRWPSPWLSAGVGLAAAVVAIVAIWFGLRPKPAATIAEFSASRASIAAGATVQLCLRATDAAQVEIGPDIGPLPANGKQCVPVTPLITTTYTATASGSDGSDAHAAITVAVRDSLSARALHIDAFDANPARVTIGRSFQLCYAVRGAELLRILPGLGKLDRFQACRTITPPQARSYTYKLLAFGDSGQVAMRRTRVEVVGLPAAPATPQTPATSRPNPLPTPAPVARQPQPGRIPNERPARRAVYQFDVTPALLERGQAASLCVGVGRWAHGQVTGIGILKPGITRCYRVHPSVTTIYRLHVAWRTFVAVETLTLSILPKARAHELAHDSNR